MGSGALSRVEPPAPTAEVRKTLSPETLALNQGVITVFDYWRTVMGIETPVDYESKRRIRARLREGFTVLNIQQAIDGCKNSPWHMGAKDGEMRNDITSICRDGGTVRRLMTMAPIRPLEGGARPLTKAEMRLRMADQPAVPPKPEDAA